MTAVVPIPADEPADEAARVAAASPPFGAFPPGLALSSLRRLTAAQAIPRPIRVRLRRLVRPVLPRRPVDVSVEGLAFRLVPGGNKVDDDILLKNRLDEPEELALLLGVVRPGDVFVDIGANIGAHTIALLARGPAGVTALALEPHPDLFPRLAFNVAANGLAGRARLLQLAVGPAGAAPLYADRGRNAGNASLLPLNHGMTPAATVPVRPLAEVMRLAGLSRIDVVKIDVEGTEDAALLPFVASAPAAALPRAILIETAHRAAWQNDCLTALSQRGYIVVSTTAENALLERAPRPADHRAPGETENG